MIASYIVPNKRLSAGSHLVQFLHNIYSQLTESPALVRFKQQNDNSWLREAVDDPDEVFKKIILFPLLECEVQHKVVIFLVDGLDLEMIQPGAAATGKYFKVFHCIYLTDPAQASPVRTSPSSSLATPTCFPGGCCQSSPPDRPQPSPLTSRASGGSASTTSARLRSSRTSNSSYWPDFKMIKASHDK